MSDEEINEETPFCLRYILPNDWSEAEKEKKSISAEKVIDAIKNGKKVEIINAVIEGPFKLKSVTAEGEVTIKRTKIKGHADWSYATFKQVLTFESSLFVTDAIFKVAAFEKDILLNGATFKGEVNFERARIGSAAIFTDAKFKQLANFNGTRIEGPAFFNSAIFEGRADFGGARIGYTAEFKGAKFKQLANFNSARIEGPAFFNSAIFEGQANFGSVRIGDNAEFYGARFKQLANFNSAQIEKNAGFVPATFEDVADFVTTRIGGNAEFNGAKFKQLANFNSAKIEKNAFFNTATFEGVANFGYARIYGNAEFDGAKFKREANFNSAKIEKNAFFRPKRLFSWNDIPGSDEVRLKELLITEFDIDWIKTAKIGKIDDGKAIKVSTEKNHLSLKLNYEKTEVNLEIDDVRADKLITKTENGMLNLYKQATFEGEANFGSAIIGGGAEFTKALFKQKADFNSAHFEGYALFNSVTFEGEADFGSAIIGGGAEFIKALFKQKANFNSAHFEGGGAKFNKALFKQSVSFNSAHFEGYVLFNPVTFEGEADFGSAIIGSSAMFTGSVFEKKATFQNAQIMEIDFADYEGGNNTQFQANIDLRGCKYDLINSIWEQLMDHQCPYDRQPFAQLEETFRRAGKDDLADDVYFKGRCREFTEIRKFTPRWFKDLFLKLLTGYGVKVKRLLVPIVVILIFGTVVFHYPEAVILKPNINQTTITIIKPQDSLIESFWVSLNLFLPGEIPSGAYWDPAPNFTSVGTFLKITGWILVPLGIAGISGILKRKSEV